MSQSENINHFPDEFSEDSQSLLLFNVIATVDELRQPRGEATPYRIMLGTPSDESDLVITVLRSGYAYKGNGHYDEEARRWKPARTLSRMITPGLSTPYDSREHISLPDNRLVEKLTISGVFKVLLQRATSDEINKWSERTVRVGWKALDKNTKSSYAREAVDSFWMTFGVNGLVGLVNADSKLEDKDRLVNAKGESALNRAITKKARDLLLNNSDVESGKYILECLKENNALDYQTIIDVESMGHPVIAEFISEHVDTEKPFESIAPSARRNMAALLLQKILTRFVDKDSDRHQQNAAAIVGTLFNSSTYNRVLPFLDVLLLSNAITQKRNFQREERERQQLLPTNEIGSVNLIHMGEAIFRILEITATTKQHSEDNRHYAEIFDELMEPYYVSFKASRPVTIADVCARYPGADEDLVLKLKEAASTKGYAYASKYYKEVSNNFGSHIRSRKHKPGYGIIT